MSQRPAPKPQPSKPQPTRPNPGDTDRKHGWEPPPPPPRKET